MSFQIEILKVRVEPQGKYRVAVVDHKLADGRIDSKKLMSFVQKDVFNKLSQAQQGDVFTIDSQKVKNEKDGKEYWTWVAAEPVGKTNGTSSAKTVSTAVRSSYESSEERAARQVYIVRQSSISNAIEYLGFWEKKDVNVDKVIAVAKQFEDYVFNGVKEEIQPTEVE